MYGLRQAHGAACRGQRGLPVQRDRMLFRSGQYRHDSRKTRVRDTHARQRVGNRFPAIQPPGDAERPRNVVADEGVGRNARGAERPWVDVEYRHREHIARFRSLDVDRTRERVHGAAHRIGIPRVYIGAIGVELQIGGIPGFQKDRLAGERMHGHGNVGVQAIETLGILPAMPPCPADHEDVILRLGVRRVQDCRTHRDRNDRAVQTQYQ